MMSLLKVANLAKALVLLCSCACLSKPLLVSHIIRTIIHELLTGMSRCSPPFGDLARKKGRFILIRYKPNCIGRRRKVSTFEQNMTTNKFTVCLARPTQISLGIYPPSLTSARCPDKEGGDPKIPIERMKRKI